MNKRNIIILAIMAIMLMGSVVLSADPVYLGTITYRVYWGNDLTVETGLLRKSFATGQIYHANTQTHLIENDYWECEVDVFYDYSTPPLWDEYGAYESVPAIGATTAHAYYGSYNMTLTINCDPSKPIPYDPTQPYNN